MDFWKFSTMPFFDQNIVIGVIGVTDHEYDIRFRISELVRTAEQQTWGEMAKNAFFSTFFCSTQFFSINQRDVGGGRDILVVEESFAELFTAMYFSNNLY